MTDTRKLQHAASFIIAMLLLGTTYAQSLPELASPFPIPITVHDDGTRINTDHSTGLEDCTQLITITTAYRTTALELRKATNNNLSFELGTTRTEEHYNLEYNQPEDTLRLTLSPTTTAFTQVTSTRQETGHHTTMDAITADGTEFIPLILNATEDFTVTFHANGRVYNLLFPIEVSQLAANRFGSSCMPTHQ